MKLISGGQTGVDRAVLDVAIALGLDYGGWCPKGGWAEDFEKPPGLLAKYPDLQETPLADPAQRTEWNVRDASACMIVVGRNRLAVSPGAALASELAQAYGKPFLIADLRQADVIESAVFWLRVQHEIFGRDFSVAIGGPRESEVPGIYEAATQFIDAVLEALFPGLMSGEGSEPISNRSA
jgi:hypothetical protein